uniref:Cauli_VI domain-containing protein n=1 Tax=Mesocestoides corti TaxID=53468 RepID=A0A5K3FU68_MESCO
MLLKQCRKPMQFEVAKVRSPDGSLFQPIVDLLKKSGYSDILKETRGTNKKANSVKWSNCEALDLTTCYSILEEGGLEARGAEQSAKEIAHSVRYVGKTGVDRRGTKSLIDAIIDSVVAEHPSPSQYLPVRVGLGELNMKVWPVTPGTCRDANAKPFLTHAYPIITVVGQGSQNPRYFGYIASNSTYNTAEGFTAYVFLCWNANEAARIVKGISSGLKRTRLTT